MDKSRDALVVRKPQRIQHAAIIRIPFGDPTGTIAERVGGEHEVHGSGARGQHLLPFRDLHMRPGAANHRDDERCARKTGPLGVGVLGLRLRVFGAKRRDDRLPGRQPCLALEDDKAPGHELAMVGNARSDRKQRFDSAADGPGPASSIGLMERRVLSSSRASGIGMIRMARPHVAPAARESAVSIGCGSHGLCKRGLVAPSTWPQG